MPFPLLDIAGDQSTSSKGLHRGNISSNKKPDLQSPTYLNLTDKLWLREERKNKIKSESLELLSEYGLDKYGTKISTKSEWTQFE